MRCHLLSNVERYLFQSQKGCRQRCSIIIIVTRNFSESEKQQVRCSILHTNPITQCRFNYKWRTMCSRSCHLLSGSPIAAIAIGGTQLHFCAGIHALGMQAMQQPIGPVHQKRKKASNAPTKTYTQCPHLHSLLQSGLDTQMAGTFRLCSTAAAAAAGTKA